MKRSVVSQRMGVLGVAQLVFEIEGLDLGWHTFRVTWSDDNGKTRLHSDFLKINFETEIKSFSENGIRNSLQEMREDALGSVE